ncbi:hypothetical protein OCK74_00440 [Chitinophagaceae bacterium LB-8]|uniref:Carboxypeptidase-like regulatory domain-containing protein n=1 Tax=Paraflavisolibacter caeni TaxID=2982496 RepID=A0A9X2XS67_9BACT|nr:hypothetical protein [Paraflavisolibacter caeni]MCU7547555.1 hypothetical protein [Paraflavisolibacter caeni]
MFKQYCILFVFNFIASTVAAQRQWMNGYLQDSATHFPIAGGTVRNANTNRSVLTNEKGFFHLEVAPNDVLYALAPSYRYDTLTYSILFTDTVTVYLAPASEVLPTITVTASDSKYKMDSMERRKEYEENMGNMVRTASSNNTTGAGIGINLDRFFKKEYKNKRKYEQAYLKAEEQAYIDYRFSPHLVAYYTGLKGNDLRDFIYRYTPSYKWLREHPTNEAVFYYINEKIKEWRKGRGKGK